MSFPFFTLNGAPAYLVITYLFGLIAYLVVYWFVLINILQRPDFDTNQRILWFLVITLAPILGLVAYWWVNCGPKPYVRPTQRPNPPDPI